MLKRDKMTFDEEKFTIEQKKKKKNDLKIW